MKKSKIQSSVTEKKREKNCKSFVIYRVDVYGNNQQYEAQNNYEQQQQHLYDQQQQYEAQQQQQQQQQYEVQLQQQHELQQPETLQPQPEPMQDDMGYDAGPSQYEQPMTPINLRGGRITRARLRSE